MRKNRYIITPVLFLVLLAALLLYGLWQDENYHTESTQTLSCKIVAVADGDTLTAQCNAMGKAGQVRIRLMAIDAPEYDYKNAVNIQPYAAQSRDHLKTMCLHKEAEISVYYEDQYGRSVADVRCQEVDVSVAQIEAGMAWVYDRYSQRTRKLVQS